MLFVITDSALKIGFYMKEIFEVNLKLETKKIVAKNLMPHDLPGDACGGIAGDGCRMEGGL